MKKIAFLLTAVIFFTANIVYANNSFNVRVENGAGKCGDTVQIGVRLENNPGVLVMHFDLEYDTERLKLVNAVDGALLDGAVFIQTFDSYPYIMLWNSASHKNFAQDGLLVNLTFKILDDAKAGDAQINLK